MADIEVLMILEQVSLHQPSDGSDTASPVTVRADPNWSVEGLHAALVATAIPDKSGSGALAPQFSPQAAVGGPVSMKLQVPCITTSALLGVRNRPLHEILDGGGTVRSVLDVVKAHQAVH